MVSAEEIVLSSDGNRTDCIFHTVVVDVVSTVKDIAAQSRKECVCIDQVRIPDQGRPVIPA